MYFRCSSCHASVWLDSFESSQRVAVNCRACHQEFRFTVEGSSEELHRHASRCAKKHGIDLPGACSVHLGLMTVAQVNELGRAPEAKATARPVEPRRRAQRFDPAFADAVERGFLSAKQAMERGRREAYAAKLRSRHGLSEKLSYAVADNRMSLIEAVRARGAQAPIKVDRLVAGEDASAGKPTSSTRSGAFLAGAVAVVLMLGAVAWFLQARGDLAETSVSGRAVREAGQRALEYQPPTDGSTEKLPSAAPAAMPASIPLGSPRVDLDESGQPLRLEASNPSAVLRAYCGIDLACDLEQPVELASAVPAASGLRIGLFSDAREGKRWAMWIRKNHRGGRWVAGDGKRPIQLVPAIDASFGDPRIPVDPLR